MEYVNVDEKYAHWSDLRGRHSNHSTKPITLTAESRAKMSKAKLGHTPWNKGVKGIPNPKTALGLRKYYDSNPDRSEAIAKTKAGRKEWYKTQTIEQRSARSEKIWRARYTRDFDRYIRARDCVDVNTVAEAQRQTGMDFTVLKKIKLRTHPFFKYFPEEA
jgi:hypothetical protein